MGRNLGWRGQVEEKDKMEGRHHKARVGGRRDKWEGKGWVDGVVGGCTEEIPERRKM